MFLWCIDVVVFDWLIDEMTGLSLFVLLTYRERQDHPKLLKFRLFADNCFHCLFFHDLDDPFFDKNSHDIFFTVMIIFYERYLKVRPKSSPFTTFYLSCCCTNLHRICQTTQVITSRISVTSKINLKLF